LFPRREGKRGGANLSSLRRRPTDAEWGRKKRWWLDRNERKGRTEGAACLYAWGGGRAVDGSEREKKGERFFKLLKRMVMPSMGKKRKASRAGRKEGWT